MVFEERKTKLSLYKETIKVLLLARIPFWLTSKLGL